MPRSGEDARQRLQRAALELFDERGYDGTTAAQIAERAGLTERTFFRHFADKREVLFDGEATLRTELERGIAAAPEGLDPLGVVALALRAAFPLIERNRSFSAPRQRVIDATPALRERALTKEATLVEAMSQALAARGLGARPAALAAQIGWSAFVQAIGSWFDDPGRTLEDHLAAALADVRAVAGGR